MMGLISTSDSNTSDGRDNREMVAFVSLEPNSEQNGQAHIPEEPLRYQPPRNSCFNEIITG